MVSLAQGVTLGLDAAAGNGTLALLRDGALLAEADVVMRSERDERFFPALLALCAQAGLALGDLQRIVVGGGPGSFTALRVVGALAKGLAQGRRIPLYAVPSLALVVPPADVPGSVEASTRWFVTLDALRGERYAALVERDARGDVLRVEQLGLVPVADIAARAAARAAIPLGPDESLAARPHARHIAQALAVAAAIGPVDVAAWEPRYGRLAEAQVKWEAAHGRPLG